MTTAQLKQEVKVAEKKPVEEKFVPYNKRNLLSNVFKANTCCGAAELAGPYEEQLYTNVDFPQRHESNIDHCLKFAFDGIDKETGFEIGPRSYVIYYSVHQNRTDALLKRGFKVLDQFKNRNTNNLVTILGRDISKGWEYETK